MSAITSRLLTRAAEDLRSLATSFGDRAELLGTTSETANELLDSAGNYWNGPRPRHEVDRVRRYLGDVRSSVDAVESARFTLEMWAFRADSVAGDLLDLENLVNDASPNLWPDGDVPSAIVGDARFADALIAETAAQWRLICRQNATSLESAMRELTRCCDAEAYGPYEVRPPGRIAFAGRVAAFSVGTGIPLSFLDPSGTVQGVHGSIPQLLTNGEYGELLYTALETAQQQDPDVANDHLGATDWPNSSNIVFMREHVEATAIEMGLDLDDATLDALAAQAVAFAFLMRSAPEGENLDGLSIDHSSGGSSAPELADVDVSGVMAAMTAAEMAGPAVGVCLEASTSYTAGTGWTSTGELGTCVISTDFDAGIIAYAGIGQGLSTGGGVSGTVAGGAIVSNAPSLDQLEGPAICFTGAAGAGVGGNGTVCGGLESDGAGGWRFNGIVTVQGNAQLSTSGGVSGSVSIVNTEVVASDQGTLRVVRQPVENLQLLGEVGADQLAGLSQATGDAASGIHCRLTQGPLAQCD